jgi:hypothetical protein
MFFRKGIFSFTINEKKEIFGSEIILEFMNYFIGKFFLNV